MMKVDPTNGEPLPTDAEVAYSLNKLDRHSKKTKSNDEVKPTPVGEFEYKPAVTQHNVTRTTTGTQSNGDETRKELERLYKCVVYDRIDDVDRMELWIKEVGIVVEKLSAIDRKQHELDAQIKVWETIQRCVNNTSGDSNRLMRFNLPPIADNIAELKAERERLGK